MLPQTMSFCPGHIVHPDISMSLLSYLHTTGLISPPQHSLFGPLHRYDPVYGARPVKRALQRELQTLLAKSLLRGDYGEDDGIIVSVTHGAGGPGEEHEQLSLTKAPAAIVPAKAIASSSAAPAAILSAAAVEEEAAGTAPDSAGDATSTSASASGLKEGAKDSEAVAEDAHNVELALGLLALGSAANLAQSNGQATSVHVEGADKEVQGNGHSISI